jgi:hypothetical protein
LLDIAGTNKMIVPNTIYIPNVSMLSEKNIFVRSLSSPAFGIKLLKTAESPTITNVLIVEIKIETIAYCPKTSGAIRPSNAFVSHEQAIQTTDVIISHFALTTAFFFTS